MQWNVFVYRPSSAAVGKAPELDHDDDDVQMITDDKSASELTIHALTSLNVPSFRPIFVNFY